MLGLKRFLRFAQNNEFVGKPKESGTDESQSIVTQLADAIRCKGYEVHTGVGTSSFRIDVAIVDPANNERYLLGIICDGQSYYRLKTARDREVVRPTVLRMLVVVWRAWGSAIRADSGRPQVSIRYFFISKASEYGVK